MANSVVIQNGITITNGVIIRNGSGTPTPGTGVITYADMNPPIIPGNQLEDGSATINGSTGVTINDDNNTGIAVVSLSTENQTFFNNLGLGTHTITFGAGSTTSSTSVEIVTLPNGSGGGGPGGSALVFFILGQSGPATYNYPFTIS